MTIRLTIPGPAPRKNRADRIGFNASTGKPVRYRSDRAKDWRTDFYGALIASPWGSLLGHPIVDGAWSLNVDIYEDRATHDGFPQGDVDSSLSAILDAMQPRGKGRTAQPGMLDGDHRVTRLFAQKFHDPENPRVEITLSRVEMPKITERARKPRKRKT